LCAWRTAGREKSSRAASDERKKGRKTDACLLRDDVVRGIVGPGHHINGDAQCELLEEVVHLLKWR
jgi:hypothetical protein